MTENAKSYWANPNLTRKSIKTVNFIKSPTKEGTFYLLAFKVSRIVLFVLTRKNIHGDISTIFLA